jgi:hypothetical protein
VAVVARHLIKRLSLATEELVEAGRIVVSLDRKCLGRMRPNEDVWPGPRHFR